MARANPQKQMQRKLYSISGRVQGVGFRPFVFRLAGRFGLTGTVRNGPEGVVLEAQGPPEALTAFAAALQNELPPLARISALHTEDIPTLPDEAAFRITASSGGLAHGVLVSPDVATCADCLDDITRAGDRRHRYPFTNCTNCGPRYTITRAMPYDRAQTSMSCFPLCPACAAEYEDPHDRRFHAQPNACPVCGPKVWLAGPKAEPLEGDDAIKELTRRLRTGAIAAIKGLGGFHLACDATSDEAVARLRRAKERPHKPLAIMVANLEEAARYVELGPDEERLLASLERPIVLCPARRSAAHGPAGGLSALLSPDTGFIGVMLPYTPLHHLLLQEAGIPLVMTSGNRGGEPIALGNREALAHLSGLADVFLLHNRDILIRTDDSVLRPIPASTLQEGDAPLMQLRRARGFVPAPLALRAGAQGRGPVLGLGAELKNTICLSRADEAFVSQHIGDVQNISTGAFQTEITRHLSALLQVEPKGLVLDAHPDFARQSGSEFAELPQKTLQHHFAHAEAVLAENAVSEAALVLALDGTGYAPPQINPEGGIWGGELILAHPAKNYLERVGSLALLPLPGGEAAIRQPWRIAHGFLHEAGLLPGAQKLPWLPAQAKTAAVLPQMLERGLNSPRTSSAGRLFDAAAALLGLCLETTYEGQAAIRLEEAQFAGRPPRDWQELYAAAPALPCPLLQKPRPGLLWELDTASLLRELFAHRATGMNPAELARAFHAALAEGLADMALAAARHYDTRLIGLSGGVMQNMSLLILLKDKLRQRGLSPLTHHRLPPNDGCIAYGQTVWGLRNF